MWGVRKNNLRRDNAYKNEKIDGPKKWLSSILKDDFPISILRRFSTTLQT